MPQPLMRVLLVQDNPEYASFLRPHLEKDSTIQFHLKSVSTLQQALDRLAAKDIDVVLLELSLPDSRGLETYEKIQAQAPAVPVVILASMNDEIDALRAVQKGAQDYLFKTEDEGKLLGRVIRCAVERNRVKTELMNLSYVDDLTGLYNRRGFMVLAEQQIKFAKRSKKGFMLIILDLDGFKQVNDLYGHIQGDAALTQTAGVLRKTFRQSDVIARIGGDEFAVIAIEASRESVPMLYNRLEQMFQEHNVQKNNPYQLAISAGTSYFDPENPASFEQLFEAADGALYQKKRVKSRS